MKTRLVGAVILACMPLLFAVCKENSPSSPSPSPATPRPTVVLTASPVPLLGVSAPGGSSTRVQVPATLTMKETAGQPARVVRLRVDITAPSGWSTSSSQDTNLAVAAFGTVTHALTAVIDVAGSDATARWKLSASAVDGHSLPFDVAPIDLELRLPPSPAPPVPDAVFVGAGDIARCEGAESEQTARLLDGVSGTVFTVGDSVYPKGTPELFARCYEPTWGRHRARTYPAPGNHDWEVAEGAPYFAYFGANAGPAGLGYYTFMAGTWQVFSLNSNVTSTVGSPQYEWLKRELAASTADCTVALWHHPLFSSGQNGGSPRMRDIWVLLLQAGADVVLNGHDHLYERFAPQDAYARASAKGIRQFTVGTGGYSLYDLKGRQPNSEVFENRTWGVLKLTLKRGSYDWAFIPIAGSTFRDAGSGTCVTPSAR